MRRCLIATLAASLGCKVVAIDAPLNTQSCAVPFEAPAPGTPLRDFLRYNFVQQKSSHNSYDKELTLTEQLDLSIRSLELDVHVARGQKDPLVDDWYVFHIDAPLLRKTSCDSLSVCLQELRAFHEEHPNHEVITVWVDLKDGFTADHTPQTLDDVLSQNMSPGSIFTPSELLAACPGATTLREAVQGDCRWPTLASLTGKFIFTVTGSGLAPGDLLADYLDGDAAARVAFAATDLETEGEVGSFEDAVFYNINIEQSALMPEVLSQSFAGRIWKTNQPGYWRRASSSCANHIATDRLDTDKYPWATTQNQNSWPFFCFESLGVDCSQLREDL